jgi:hypothetical protein
MTSPAPSHLDRAAWYSGIATLSFLELVCKLWMWDFRFDGLGMIVVCSIRDVEPLRQDEEVRMRFLNVCEIFRDLSLGRIVVIAGRDG